MRNKGYLSSRDNGMFPVERDNLKRVKRMQNVALLTDLATNLAAIIARSKGARYTTATNLSSRMSPYIMQAKERLRAAQNDYNGKIANFYLRGIGDGGNNTAYSTTTPEFISKTDTPNSAWGNENNRLFTKK